MTASQRSLRLKGCVLTLLGGLCWAVGGIFGQVLFEQCGVTANWLVPYRLTLGGVILLLLALLTHHDIFSVWRDREGLPAMLIFSLFGSAATQYTYYSSVQYSNAAVGTVLSYMSPVAILLWKIVSTRKRPMLYEVVSVLLVLAGAAVCATHLEPGALAVSPLALAFGIASAICFAFYTISPRELIRKHDVLSVTGWGMLIGGILLLLVLHPWTIGGITQSPRLYLAFAAVILFGTVMSFGCFQAGCTIVGSLTGSILSSVEPIGSVVLSVLFLHARFTLCDLLGFAMILSTVFIISIGDARHLSS